MSDVTYEQTYALAAICQAGYLIQELSKTGRIDQQQLSNVLSWVIETNPNSIECVFVSEQNLKEGFQIIHDQLGHKSQPKDAILTRYALGLMTLERKLSASKVALDKMGKGIDDINRQLNHFDITDEQVIANFAGMYKNIVSPLGAKIQIFGNPHLLQQNSVQDKIRAILLAGMRATVLWRQLGGKRRNIIFRRNKWVQISAQVLNKLD